MGNNKIDFLVVGAQKAGTTALFTYLNEHPEIGLAKKKEVHFFDKDDLFLSQHPDYNSYHDYFDFEKGHSTYGEITPIYMYWNPCCDRIWEYNPQVKLIFILRNPIERAFSHWLMEYERGSEHLDFSDCIRQEESRLNKSSGGQHRVYSYQDRGFYSHQIQRFSQRFPMEQMLFIKYDEFLLKQEATLDLIYDFLKVGRTSFSFRKVHQRKLRFELKAADRDYLRAQFDNEIKDLEQLLGWDCGNWLQ